MDPFLIFLSVVISIVSLVLVIAGIQVILILRNVNKTLNRTNQALDQVDYLVHHFTNPLTDLKSLGKGVKTGLHVAEYIANWIAERKKNNVQEEA